MKILALLKGDHRDEHIIEALDLVSNEDDQVTILNIVPVSGEIPLKANGEVLDYCTEYDLSGYHTESKSILEKWALKEEYNAFEKLSLVGSPAKIATSKALDNNFDLIISGAHVTSILEDLFVDTFSASIINGVKIPYLTVASSTKLDEISHINVLCNANLKQHANFEVIKRLQEENQAKLSFVHLSSEEPIDDWKLGYEELANEMEIKNYEMYNVVSSNIQNVISDLSKNYNTGIIAFSEKQMSSWLKLFNLDNRVNAVNHLDHPILIF